VIDVHSLWVAREKLYVVSTGTDEVIELHMRGAEVTSERVFWRPISEGPRADVHHLNAIYSWRGDMLVSGIGQNPGEDWGLARDGFVFNITRGEKLASGLHHPHSLMAIDDTIAYCESKKMVVRITGRAYIQHLPGYTRGLCRIGQKLFVGTSLERRVSKSTGKRKITWVPGGRCTVSRLSVNSFEVEDTIDLTTYGDEIYDMLPIEGTEKWPVGSNMRFESAEVTWQNLISLTTQEVAATIPPESAFILVDDQGLGEEVSAGRPVIPFLERDGQYWGHPPNDLTAISELERLRRGGARFMVVVWPAFWWLDYYAGFYRHLRSQFRCVLQNERLVMFDLRP
jgi:Domain of unknown function (DUF4915)